MAVYSRNKAYGLIQLSAIAETVCTLPLLTRLGEIRQLGTVDIIWPHANYTRYEHSRGVAHLGRLTVPLVLKNSGLSYSDTQIARFQLWVELAGLCHDTGHGPFSHLFDHFLEEEGKVTSSRTVPTEHEERSCRLIRAQLPQVTGLTSLDVDVVCYLVDPTHQPRPPDCPEFLAQFIANPTHGLDLDKLDYLARDRLTFESPQWPQDLRADAAVLPLIESSCLVDGVWSFPQHMQSKVTDLYLWRYRLHEHMYNHQHTRAANRLVLEIFQAHPRKAEILRACRLETPDDIHTFLQLKDTILEEVLWPKHDQFPNIQALRQKVKHLLMPGNRMYWTHQPFPPTFQYNRAYLPQNIVQKIPWVVYRAEAP